MDAGPGKCCAGHCGISGHFYLLLPVAPYEPRPSPSLGLQPPLSPSFSRRDPATAEEEELVENLFDATCSALMLPENRTLFVQAEGE